MSGRHLARAVLSTLHALDRRQSSVAGSGGNDVIGSSNDRLAGGLGVDVIYGAGGNDRFFTVDSEIDQLCGGSGRDVRCVM